MPDFSEQGIAAMQGDEMQIALLQQHSLCCAETMQISLLYINKRDAHLTYSVGWSTQQSNLIAAGRVDQGCQRRLPSRVHMTRSPDSAPHYKAEIAFGCLSRTHQDHALHSARGGVGQQMLKARRRKKDLVVGRVQVPWKAGQLVLKYIKVEND